jgi:hypothetical protein
MKNADISYSRTLYHAPAGFRLTGDARKGARYAGSVPGSSKEARRDTGFPWSGRELARKSKKDA